MQAAVSLHCRHPVTPRLWRNGIICCCTTSFAAYGAHLTMHVNGDDSAVFRFLSLVTKTIGLEIQTRRARDQTRLLCEFGANPFSSSRDISYHTETKKNKKEKATALKMWIRGYWWITVTTLSILLLLLLRPLIERKVAQGPQMCRARDKSVQQFQRYFIYCELRCRNGTVHFISLLGCLHRHL